MMKEEQACYGNQGAVGRFPLPNQMADRKNTMHDELLTIESELREISSRAYEFACRAGFAYPAEADIQKEPRAENLNATVSRIRRVVGDVRKTIEAIESIA